MKQFVAKSVLHRKEIIDQFPKVQKILGSYYKLVGAQGSSDKTPEKDLQFKLDYKVMELYSDFSNIDKEMVLTALFENCYYKSLTPYLSSFVSYGGDLEIEVETDRIILSYSARDFTSAITYLNKWVENRLSRVIIYSTNYNMIEFFNELTFPKVGFVYIDERLLKDAKEIKHGQDKPDIK